MAAKDITPIEALERKQLAECEARHAAIAAATADVRATEQLLREAVMRLQQLQAEQMRASFAFDAERDRLALESVKAKAA